MKRMSTLFGALLVVAALASCVVAASASAAKVPGFLLLPGESSTLTFTSTANTFATELQGAAGTLVGTGVKLKISLTADDEGTYTADFEAVRNKKGEKCNTVGDEPETVLVPNNKVRTVHDTTSTTGSGLLFEVNPEFKIVCAGGEEIHVKGTDLGLFEAIRTKAEEEAGEKTDFNKFLGSLYCKNTSGGEPFEEKFWGLSGVEEKAKLESNFGSGFKKACELVGTVATTKVELISNKMTELMEVG